jgi:hypothetical protein
MNSGERQYHPSLEVRPVKVGFSQFGSSKQMCTIDSRTNSLAGSSFFSMSNHEPKA